MSLKKKKKKAQPADDSDFFLEPTAARADWSRRGPVAPARSPRLPARPSDTERAASPAGGAGQRGAWQGAVLAARRAAAAEGRVSSPRASGGARGGWQRGRVCVLAFRWRPFGASAAAARENPSAGPRVRRARGEVPGASEPRSGCPVQSGLFMGGFFGGWGGGGEPKL